MKLFLCVLSVVICVLSVSSFPTTLRTDVPSQCRDPTFACQDLLTARSCQTVSDCIHDVWETMKVPNDNDEICDICKEMVKEARDQLLSNMTQEEIKEVFEGSCKLLPIKLVADACIKVVDEVIPQLVEMLASRMDPTMVCTVSGMCFASKKPAQVLTPLSLLRSLVVQPEGTQCNECKTMLTDVQVFLNSTTEDQVKTYMEDFCGEKMPKYLCDIIMNHYFHDVYNTIKTSEPEQLCGSVGICPNQANALQVGDDLTCEFCEHLLQHVKDLITTNTTMDEFKTALLNFCKQTGKFSDKCTEMVTEYYDMLFNYIKQLDTKGMCTLMGLCNGSSVQPLVKLFPATDMRKPLPRIQLLPAQQPNKVEFSPMVRLIPAKVSSKKQMRESNDIFPALGDKFSHPLPLMQQDEECALCTAISFFLEKDLGTDRRKASIRNKLEGVCEKWMQNYPEECSRIITRYSLKIEMALAKGASFHDLCPLLKMCPLKGGMSVTPGDKPLCNLCKDALQEVQDMLSDPDTKKKLQNLFGMGCKIVPESLRDDCTSFIDQNIDAAIDILQQELKPDNVCPRLRLCSGGASVSYRDKPLCDVCKDALQAVEDVLSDPDTKKKLQNLFGMGCKILPESLRDGCTSFINQNINEVIDILQQELKPDNVCPRLRLCSASSTVAVPQRVKDLECDVCKDVVTSFRKKLQDPASKEIVQTFLEEGCARLPESVAAECKKFVDENIDTVMNIIITEMDPDQVCSILKICPASLRSAQKAPGGIECETCKVAIGELQKLVKNEGTEDEIKKTLLQVCSHLPAKMGQQCTNLVNQYTDIFVTYIVNQLDPDLLCGYIKLCPASELVAKPKVKTLECDLCKEVVSKVEDMVKDEKTEEEIKKALETVCSYLPSSLSAKCSKFVVQYTDLIVTLLMQELDPDVVCAELNLCPDKSGPPHEQITRAQDFECQSCQDALHYIQNQLMSTDIQEEIKNLAKHVCDILPDSLSSNCGAFVDEYGSSLLTLLAQELDPSVLCYQLQMCSNGTAPGTPLLHSFQIDECSVCTTVVDYVDKLLEEDDVDQEITHVVEKVCSVVPSTFRTKCTSMLEAYGPYILQMIGQVADSRQLCQEIDMCPRTTGHVQLIGGSKCTFGPSYWCASAVHAAACKAQNFCETRVWKTA